MGAVYLAEHPLIGKKVAMKVLHPEFSAKENIVARFFNEAKAVNDIQHPNIVDIIDYGDFEHESRKVVYFIMEFLDGRELTSEIRIDGVIAPVKTVDIAGQVADALSASHGKGVVHRDLKPDNIVLLAKKNNPHFVKLLDFGIAKLTNDDSGDNKTQTGMIMGTPAYMSPEQCEGRNDIDARTDIYALGIVVYEMLTGRPPFVGEGYGEVIMQHMALPAPKLTSINSDIPPDLEAVVLKSLQKHPNDRYQNILTFKEALNDPTRFIDNNGGMESFLETTLTDKPQYILRQPTNPEVALEHTQLNMTADVVTKEEPSHTQLKKKKSRMLPIALASACLLGVVFLMTRKQEVATKTPPQNVTDKKEIAPSPQIEPKAPSFVTINVVTTPPGAEVLLNNEYLGTTPAELKLDQADAIETFTFKQKGFDDTTRNISLAQSTHLEVALKKTNDSRKKGPKKKTNRAFTKKRQKQNSTKTKPPPDQVATQKNNTPALPNRIQKTGDNTLKPDF